jgi:hypothetical protein
VPADFDDYEPPAGPGPTAAELEADRLIARLEARRRELRAIGRGDDEPAALVMTAAATALADRLADRVDSGRTTLVEAAGPWGNRWVGPTHREVARGQYAGTGTAPGVPGRLLRPQPPNEPGYDPGPRWTDQGTGRVVDPADGGRGHGQARRERVDTSGTLWVGDRPRGPCPACGDAIRAGSARYCDACGASGRDDAALAALVAALARELDREHRGLKTTQEFDEQGRYVRLARPADEPPPDAADAAAA